MMDMNKDTPYSEELHELDKDLHNIVDESNKIIKEIEKPMIDGPGQPPKPPPSDGSSAKPDDKGEAPSGGTLIDSLLKRLLEDHRFTIAILIISIFAVALWISLIPSFKTDPQVIFSAFGGWIAAVLTFYFSGQAVDTANKNTEAATKSATEATKSAATSKSEAESAKTDSLNNKKLADKNESKVHSAKGELLQLNKVYNEMRRTIDRRRIIEAMAEPQLKGEFMAEKKDQELEAIFNKWENTYNNAISKLI